MHGCVSSVFQPEQLKGDFASFSYILAKNQLASSGPVPVKPVLIPALSNVLDSSLAVDRTLCPVRVLRYYLDRTKNLELESFSCSYHSRQASPRILLRLLYPCV